MSRSDFGGTLKDSFTAHPKFDPKTGENLAITYRAMRKTVNYVVVSPEGLAETRAEIPAPHEPMVHDVGFTKNFVVVLDLPVTFQPTVAFNPSSLPRSPFPYLWNPSQPPRVGLLPRSGDLGGLRWFDAPSCYVFHILNAYENSAGIVVVDVVRHPRMFVRDRNGINEGTPVLARWTFDPATKVLAESIIDDHGCEFPRFDTRLGGQNYRFGYTAHLRDRQLGPIMKHDLHSGRTEVHDFGAGCASREPIFVPRTADAAEDDGYVLSYVYDANRNTSDVVILAAQDFAGEPVAVVELPVRVPFGFHGDWIADAE